MHVYAVSTVASILALSEGFWAADVNLEYFLSLLAEKDQGAVVESVGL